MPEKYLDKNGLSHLWSKIPKEQVWVGSEEPTGDQTVWIDPTGSETAGLVTQAELASKQDKLTAGTNITIDSNNVISATGSSGGGSYTLPVASDNTLGGVKTGAVYGKPQQVNIGGVPIRITQDGVGYIPFASNTSHGIPHLGDQFRVISNSGLVGLNPPYKFDSGFLIGAVCPDGTTITMTDDGMISASVPPAATTSTLGTVKPDGNTILVADDGTISSAAGGLIGKSMKGYDQPTSEWGWIADWAQHPEKYYVVIKGINDTEKDCPVIYTAVYGSQFYYYWFEGNTLHARYINFTDSTLSQVESVSQYGDSGTVWLTEQNWSQYITTGGGSDWQVTTSTSDGNLYNAKEVVIFWQDNNNYSRHQSYLNVGCDYWGNSGQTWGSSNWINTEIILDGSTQAKISYDGANINTNNCTIEAICYKT